MGKRVPWAKEDLAMPRSHVWIRVLLPVALAVAFVLGCVAYPRDGSYPSQGGYPNGGGHPSDGGYNQQPVPRGSYLASCEGVRLDGSRLKASCRTQRGTWRRSSLDIRVCDDDIANRDGYLRCSQNDRFYGALPPGSYVRSCTHVQVRRGQLEADCRSNDHSWRRSTIAVNACQRFRNRDGRLGCE